MDGRAARSSFHSFILNLSITAVSPSSIPSRLPKKRRRRRRGGIHIIIIIIIRTHIGYNNIIIQTFTWPDGGRIPRSSTLCAARRRMYAH